MNTPAPAPDAEPVTMRLVVTCPDRVGIVAAVARFLAEAGANIESSHQHSSNPSDGTFFLRMQFVIAATARVGLAERFGSAVAERFGMTWRLGDVRERKRIAVLVSRQDHCLTELLWRWRRPAHIERSVLARAVQWHCQDRVLRHKSTTVVF